MSSAAAPSERRVEVVAGLDEQQLEAAWRLHTAHAEEIGCSFDAEAWADELRAAIARGAFNLGVAWDGDLPIGVVEMHIEYDSMTNRRVAWGQRAYVLPDYRRADVFKSIFDYGEEGARFLGLDACRACADNDWYGRAMKRFYESRGFTEASTVMEKSLWHG